MLKGFLTRLAAGWRAVFAAPVQSAPSAPARRRLIDVSPEALARARSGAKGPDPFKVRPQLHPKGVGPAGDALAMDECFSDVSSWAMGGYGGLLAEGQAFLGYPILAELAQRPEYRRISETIAMHMTRKWVELQATGDEDKSQKISEIETEMARLDVRGAFRRAVELDGQFGRGHVFIDFGDDLELSNNPELKTDLGDGSNDVSTAKIGKGKTIKALKPVEPVWCYPTRYNSSNPLKPDWYRPTTWYVMATEVHASRLLTIVAREVPDLLKPAYSFGGLSLSQMLKPYVDNWIETRQGVNDIITSFSTFVLKTNLADTLMVGGEKMFRRAELFNEVRDNRGLLLIDKEDEDFANVSAPLSGLDQLQAQAQEHMCSVSAIPVVELLGISPAGLNASSEGEIATFEARIEAEQERQFRAPVSTVINMIQLSLYGEVDATITFAFKKLHAMDDADLSEKQNKDANTDSLLIDAGVIQAEEARTRWANDPDSPYPGLSTEMAGDPPAPGEGEGPPAPPKQEAEPKPEAAEAA